MTLDQSVFQKKTSDDTVASILVGGVDKDVREVGEEVGNMTKFFKTLAMVSKLCDARRLAWTYSGDGPLGGGVGAHRVPKHLQDLVEAFLGRLPTHLESCLEEVESGRKRRKGEPMATLNLDRALFVRRPSTKEVKEWPRRIGAGEIKEGRERRHRRRLDGWSLSLASTSG